MTKLIACMSVYNEEPQMVPCLDLVKDIINGVCLVDGVFFGYPVRNLYSTDNTIKVTTDWCKEHDKELTIIKYGGYRQKNKRTQYFKNPCRNPDSDTWMFILDPDNQFEDLGDFRKEFDEYANMKDVNDRNKHNDLSILCSEQQLFGEARRAFPKALLLRWEEGLKYQPNHWIVSDKNNVLYCATNVSKSHVLPGKVINRPLDRKDWKRLWERSLFRALRLLASPSQWGLNFYETGNDTQATYIDSPEALETFRRNLQYRVDKMPTDLDLAMVGSINWVKKGSLTAPSILSEFNRGQVLGLLIAFGVCPNPYSGEPESDV